MRTVFGIIIILIGVLFLGENFSWWKDYDISLIWQLWPLLLVVFGVSILAKRTSYSNLITLIITVLAILFAAAVVLKPEIIGLPEDANKISSEKTIISESLPEGVETAQIEIKTGATSLNVNSSSEKLIEGDFSSGFNQPDFTVKTVDDTALIDIKTDTSPSMGWRWNRDRVLNLQLNQDLETDLSIDSGASKMDLDLTEIKISRLSVNTGAASLVLKLGEFTQPDAVVDLKGGASSFDIKFPQNIGVEINSETGLSSNTFNQFDKISEKVYRSKDYTQKSKKITLNISAGVSSVSVKSY